jgi:hypothetical protein
MSTVVADCVSGGVNEHYGEVIEHQCRMRP